MFSRSCDGGKGGDLYYFSVCDNDSLTRIAIADVMGHGEKVSKTSQWLYNSLNEQMNSADGSLVLSNLNQKAVEFGSNAFSTATIAAFYRADNHFYFSYAGHHPVVIYSTQEGKWLNTDIPDSDGMFGLPLGVDEDSCYEQGKTSLNPGDKIFLYTDGVIEAIDGKLQPFGENRLMAVLNDNVHESPAGIKQRVLESLDEFTGQDLSHDDVTFLAVEIL